MPTPHLKFEPPDGHGIAVVTLDRSEKLNSLTLEMLDDMDAALAAIDADSSCRVVLVTSSGERAFCAGAGILAWSDLGPLGMWRQWIRRGHQIFDRLATLRQPTIAVVQGIAFGGGLELALACDVRLAAESARFGLPEASLGTIPGWAGTQRLPRTIGVGRAKQMVFTAQPIDADTACKWGLVNEVCSDEEVLVRAQAMAKCIASNAPIAVQTGKQLLNGGESVNLTATLESLASAVNAATQDAKEGLAAFRERRTPLFTGE